MPRAKICRWQGLAPILRATLLLFGKPSAAGQRFPPTRYPYSKTNTDFQQTTKFPQEKYCLKDAKPHTLLRDVKSQTWFPHRKRVETGIAIQVADA